MNVFFRSTSVSSTEEESCDVPLALSKETTSYINASSSSSSPITTTTAAALRRKSLDQSQTLMSRLQDENSGVNLNHPVKMRPKKHDSNAVPVSAELDNRKYNQTVDNRMSWVNEATLTTTSLKVGLPPSTFYSEDNHVFQRTFSQETCDSNFEEAYSQESFQSEFSKTYSQDSCYFSQTTSYDDFKEPPAKRSPTVDRRLYDRHILPAFGGHSSQSSYSSTDNDSHRSEGES